MPEDVIELTDNLTEKSIIIFNEEKTDTECLNYKAVRRREA